MISFLPYQLEYIRHKSNLIYEKSRQIGVTYAAAFKSILRALDKNDTFYVAQDEKSSKNFISLCSFFAKEFEIPEVEVTALGLTLGGNCSKIVALTSNPRTLRGKTGSVILDEFAFHLDQDDLLAAAVPVTTWGGSLEIISTHNGPNSVFYRMLLEAREEEDSSYKILHTDVYDAISQGLAQKIAKTRGVEISDDAFLKEIRSKISSFAWEQEYECKIASEGSTIVGMESYKGLLSKHPIPDFLEDRDYGELYAGIDVGRTKNYTVLWIIEKCYNDEEDKIYYKTVCIKWIQNMDLTKQTKILDKIVGHKCIVKCAIDQGLFGRSISDDLLNAYGKKVIIPIGFSNKLEAELCEITRKAVEYEQIDFPDNNLIMHDICSMRQTYTNSGNIRYEGGVGDSHADFFYALALAIKMAEQFAKKKLMFAI